LKRESALHIANFIFFKRKKQWGKKQDKGEAERRVQKRNSAWIRRSTREIKAHSQENPYP
jgi:hypothetical protein